MEKSSYIQPEKLASQNNTTVTEMIGEYYLSSTVPACCKHGCVVKPDGACSHGHPSLLVAMGIV